MWLTNLFKAIQTNGGFMKSLVTFHYTDSLKYGDFIGKDPFGNRYFENSCYFLSSNRWVIYSEKFGYDVEGDRIHVSWFRWMHHMTDVPAHQENYKEYPWMLPYEENKTGTSESYYPYSTVHSKIKPWKPPIKIKH